MNNKQPILSSKTYQMLGRQRISCTLELGEDKVVRLYGKKDGSLRFEVPANTLLYSVGNLVKPRIRLSTVVNGSETGVRLGVWSIDKETSDGNSLKENEKPSSKKTARDIWVATLAEYGATENPKHPEEKIDKFGGLALFISLSIIILIALLSLLMQ